MRGLCWLVLGACGRVGFDATPPPSPAPDAPPGPFTLRGPGTWSPLPEVALAPRVWTSGIWTGAELVVYSGATDASYTPINDGARYEPTSGTWTPMSSTPSPAARHTARMAMVNGDMIEYGGGAFFNGIEGGGRYDLGKNGWSVMASSTPGARIYNVAVAMGARMLTFGGWASATQHLDTAFVYDPATDTWTQTSTLNAPSARSFATAVWTGSEALVWGGCDGNMPACGGVKGDGARYDPASDTWQPISSTGAPSARAQHVAVWTGSEMIVWGGAGAASEGTPLADGAIYSPTTDTWRPMSTTAAPSARVDPGAAWLFDKMVVWGGDNGQDDGFLYDPVADAWSAMSTVAAPELRARFAFAVSDSPPRVFVWGGSFSTASGSMWTPEP